MKAATVMAREPAGAATHEHVFLAGRPPMGEFVGFVSSQAANPGQVGVKELSDAWRRANDAVRIVEKEEAGFADNPAILPLPSEMEAWKSKVLADAVFQNSFNVVPYEIALVELDRLVIFQKFINLEFVKALHREWGMPITAETMVRECLPVDRPLPPMKGLRVGQNAFEFVSPSTDFRMLDPTILAPGQVFEHASTGPVSAYVAVPVGYGSNFSSAIQVENRLILNNGSHRAFALRKAGVTHAPCVIQRVTRIEELEMVTAAEVAVNHRFFVKTPRPPLLKDYFDERLHVRVAVPVKVRRVRVVFNVEQLDSPAA